MSFCYFISLKIPQRASINTLNMEDFRILIHLELTDETVFDYLKNISQSILFRDVVSRFEVRNVDFLVCLIKYLANETGNLISARGIGNFLKSQNISISITAILNYLTTAMLISNVQRSYIQEKKVFEVGEKY